MCCAEPEVEIEDDQDELTDSYTFEQLSDKAKAATLDHCRDWNVSDCDWWDCVYEDAVRMGALMGIYIGTRGKTNCDIDICFSGFCSQGDGSSFAGEYKPKAEAVKNIADECNDDELIRIAQQLTVMQVACKLEWDDHLEATISHPSGNYFGLKVEVQAIDPIEAINQRPGCYETEVTPEEEKQLTALLNDFNDWIYAQLEAEYDHLTSDEAIKDTIEANGTLFDGDGTII